MKNFKLIISLIVVLLVIAAGVGTIYGREYISKQYTINITGYDVLIKNINRTPQEYLFPTSYENITSAGSPLWTTNGGQTFEIIFSLTYVNATVTHQVLSLQLISPEFQAKSLKWNPNQTDIGYGTIGFSGQVVAPYSNYNGPLEFVLTLN